MENSNANTANIQQKLCLATVSSKDYWPGTSAMLNSFLKHNSWFRGEIAIISRDTKYIKKKIKKSKHLIKLINPSPELLEKILILKNECLYIKEIETRFYVLEIFRLLEYDRVIYYDSDILHVRAIEPALIMNKDMLAAFDPSFYRGFIRERKTLRKVKMADKSANTLEQFFNSGFLVAGKKYLDENIYQQLIGEIDIELFSSITDKLADEPVLNKVFENCFSVVAVDYNCSVHLLVEDVIKTSPFSIHFTGYNKPWQTLSWVQLVFHSKKYYKFLIQWLRASFFEGHFF